MAPRSLPYLVVTTRGLRFSPPAPPAAVSSATATTAATPAADSLRPGTREQGRRSAPPPPCGTELSTPRRPVEPLLPVRRAPACCMGPLEARAPSAWHARPPERCGRAFSRRSRARCHARRPAPCCCWSVGGCGTGVRSPPPAGASSHITAPRSGAGVCGRKQELGVHGGFSPDEAQREAPSVPEEQGSGRPGSRFGQVNQYLGGGTA